MPYFLIQLCKISCTKKTSNSNTIRINLETKTSKSNFNQNQLKRKSIMFEKHKKGSQNQL